MLDWTLYKEGQGKWARNSVAAVIAILAIMATTSVYESLIEPTSQLEISESWWDQWLRVTDWPFDYRFAVIGPLLVALLAFGFWQYNHPRWSDFLIDTENEMKNRVAWPNRRELINASIVVVVAVIVIGGFTFLSDSGLLLLFSRLIYLGLGGEGDGAEAGT